MPVRSCQYHRNMLVSRFKRSVRQSLICARWKGHAGVVSELLRSGADPNRKNRSGGTPLHKVSASPGTARRPGLMI
jgi:ankyrin repeat protein